MKKVILLTVGVMLNLSFAYAGRFEGSFTIKMEAGKSSARKEPSMEMNVLMKGNQILMIPGSGANDKGPKTKILMDTKEGTTIILMDNNGKKHGMKRPTNEQGLKSNSRDDAKVTETKEKKTIDGYSCRKVIIESSTSKTEAWFTNDITLQLTDLSLTLSAGRGPSGDFAKLGTKVIQGCPIELTTFDKKTKAENIMHIKNIKKGGVTDADFSTAGYTISPLPVHPGGPGKGPGKPTPPGKPGVPNGPRTPGAPDMPSMPTPPGGAPTPPQGRPGQPVPPHPAPPAKAK